ncbi:histone-lysine N-methyltransferase SETMAR [Trichonephila clavipes]|nr:histone-lysine N-methyltransferase SETMAR [Trichonephila clavipes]
MWRCLKNRAKEFGIDKCYINSLVSFPEDRPGDLSLCDKSRPQALDDEALQAAIEKDSSQTHGELARQFNTSSEMVRLHLHRLGKKNRLRKLPPLPFSLDDHLRGKSFTNVADVRQDLTDFFASHTPEFNRKGIEQLEPRWQKVLDGDSDYFED